MPVVHKIYTGPMSDEPKDLRIPIMMSASEVKAIDDWSFENRIRSRAEAIRRLCQMGLGLDSELKVLIEILKPAMDESHRMRELFDDPAKIFTSLENGLKELIEHIVTINSALGQISKQVRGLTAVSVAYKTAPEVEDIISHIDVKSIIEDLKNLKIEEYIKKYNVKLDENPSDPGDKNAEDAPPDTSEQ